ncbi:claudin-7-like [Eudromia elegans]
MASGALQLLGLALAVAGWAALAVATALPQWQVSSFAGDTIVTAVATAKGLWMACAWQSTGQLQCKVYDSLLSLSPSLQATRALMVVALVLGALALVVATMGMKCTRCGDEDKARKARVATAGGVIYVVAGLAALVTCSWYGHQIVRDFYDVTVPVNLKYEFGAAIFVGWAGSALTLLGGALLSCSCSKGGKTPPAYARAQPPRSATSREYV